MGGRVLPDTTVAPGWVQPSAVPPFCVHSWQNSVCATTLCFAAPLLRGRWFVQERRTLFQLCCEVVQVVFFLWL